MTTLHNTTSPENTSTAISELISKGLVPLLPIEREAIKAQLEEMISSQDELSSLLSEAMQQSSETWHDNAPADAINHASRTLGARADSLITTLRNSIDVPYPTQEASQATVGSMVSVNFAGDSDSMNFFISGAVRNLNVFDSEEEHHPTVVTAASPIGKALLGKECGDEAEYEGPNGKTISVIVNSIDQIQF